MLSREFLREKARKARYDAYCARNLLISPDNFFLIQHEKPMYIEPTSIRANSKQEVHDTEIAAVPKKSPPRMFRKSVFGWHDPLATKVIAEDEDPVQAPSGLVVSINGIEVKWHDDEEASSSSICFSELLFRTESRIPMDDSAMSEDSFEADESDRCLSAMKIQGAYRMYKARKEKTRKLLMSQKTAVTILQKWHHIAKINLRIRRVTLNKAIAEDQAARAIQAAMRAFLESRIIKRATKERLFKIRQTEASVAIQCAWRSKRAKVQSKNLWLLFYKMNRETKRIQRRAAEKIQVAWKMHVGNKRLLESQRVEALRDEKLEYDSVVLVQVFLQLIICIKTK